MTGNENSESVQTLRQALRRVLKSPTDDYQEVLHSSEVATAVLREEIATAVQTTINGHLRRSEVATFPQKRLLATTVTEELRSVGLAIQCPHTGRACTLQAHPGRDREVGRFRLEYADERGQRHHPMTSVELPTLTVMPLPVVAVKDPHKTNKGR